MLLNHVMLLKAVKNPSLSTCELQGLRFKHNALLSCETRIFFAAYMCPCLGSTLALSYFHIFLILGFYLNSNYSNYGYKILPALRRYKNGDVFQHLTDSEPINLQNINGPNPFPTAVGASNFYFLGANILP